MSDTPEEVEKCMKKEIWICSDVWLSIFGLLSSRKIGLQIALLSRRFDRIADKHFERRKKLRFVQIRRKFGTNQMEIVNARGKLLPIPQVPLPNRVTGFRGISISYVDQNVVDFLCHFRHLFSLCAINLSMEISAQNVLAFVVRNILPLISANICAMNLWSVGDFRRLRKIVPTFLGTACCPSLRTLIVFCRIFPAFPPDDSVDASPGQAVAKWLFAPSPPSRPGSDDAQQPPKMIKIVSTGSWQPLATGIDGIKETFSNASSRADFIIAILWAHFVPFELTNKGTGERLVLKQYDSDNVLLIRCPIVRNEQKWAKWETEAIGWRQFVGGQQRNRISMRIIDNQIGGGDGALDPTPGPSCPHRHQHFGRLSFFEQKILNKK